MFKLGHEARFISAVTTAVGHFAERIELASEARADVVAAAEEACHTTLRLLPGPDTTLHVSVEDFADRLEVTLQHEGEAMPPAGLGADAVPAAAGESATGPSGVALLSRADRVLCNSDRGISRTTLVKYARPPRKK